MGSNKKIVMRCILPQDLNTIAETIKQRTVQQIKAALQKKAFDDAGIAVQSITSSASNQKLMQGNDPPCAKKLPTTLQRFLYWKKLCFSNCLLLNVNLICRGFYM
jgi:hypothetical protein